MILADLERNGFAVAESLLDESALAKTIALISSVESNLSTVERGNSTFAMRNFLRDHAIIRELADSPPMRSLVDPILGSAAIAVRGILFDKTPGANWKVPWHQDLSIAVTERVDVQGYGPWSVKAGVPHVQPPVEILQNMMTVRLALDDCGIDNGPLLVLPRSHVHGILTAEQVNEFRENGKPVAATVDRGGAVLMRPLLLHASHAATSPAHRRVVHIEYAAVGLLPAELRWFIA